MALWNQLLDYSKQLFALARTVQEHDREIKALREDVAELRREFRDVLEAVRAIRVEQLHDREMAAKDREILLLRLENTLQQFERRLPPGGSEP